MLVFPCCPLLDQGRSSCQLLVLVKDRYQCVRIDSFEDIMFKKLLVITPDHLWVLVQDRRQKCTL